MKHINRTLAAIAQLKYNNAADCVELRLFLLSILSEFVNQYRNIDNKERAAKVLATYKELEAAYKNFTMATEEPNKNYKAQFEFTKSIILGKINRFSPYIELSNVA